MSPAWQTVRVFISSTFKDMHAERDHLVGVVFPELAERMAARRLHLRAVDLRWGVLEEEDSLDVCLGIVEECRPFFVGLLGGRYGYVPPPPREIERQAFERALDSAELTPQEAGRLRRLYRYDPYLERYRRAELTSGLEEELGALLERAAVPWVGESITALEIHRGVLEDASQRMVSRFYFRDPVVTAAIPPPHRADYVEEPADRREALERLKQRIVEAGLEPRVYRCRWDPALERLVDLEELGRMVLEDLWAAIAERYPADPGLGEDAVAAERRASDHLVETRLQHFVGRHTQIDELWSFARDRSCGGNGPGTLCVTGEPGVGKTALLGSFYRAYALAHPEQAVVGHFVGASPASTNVREMLTRVWREVDRAAGTGEEPPASHSEIVRALPEFLARAAETRPICLVIDAVDQLEATHDAHDMRWLPELLPERVAVVVSALDGPALAALRRRRVPPLELELGRLGDEEAHALVDGYLAEQSRKLGPEQLAALLGKPAARNPLYLLVALEELRAVGRFEALDDQIRDLPGTIPDLYQDLLERLEREHGEDLVRDFTALVAVGRGGQIEEDLRAMLRPPGELRLPDLPWARLFRSLAFHLLRRSELVDFYHRQLRQAVEARYLGSGARERYHARCADHLAVRGHDYPRTLSELPHHRSEAGQAEALFALLDPPEFRDRKLAVTRSVHALCEDLVLAVDAALAQEDLPRLARFAFLHADYAEGRFGTGDLLDGARERGERLRDARFLRERPRFRALVFLAGRDAEAGQTEAAAELIAEAAAIRGIELPGGDVPFLAAAVRDLLRAGCQRAPELLVAAFGPFEAARAAAVAAEGLDDRGRTLVLEPAIGWLDASTTVAGSGEKLVDAFGALADAAAAGEDVGLREALFDRLEELAGSVCTLLDKAIAEQDVIRGVMGIGISLLEGGIGSGARPAIRARLGAARVRSVGEGRATGDSLRAADERGDRLMETAIEECAAPITDSSAYREIVRALRSIPPPRSIELFRRLAETVERSGSGSRYREILAALGEPGPTDGLGEMVAIVGPRVAALGIRERSPLLRPLALAHARAGQVAQARWQAAFLTVGLSQLRLMAWNPLIAARHKLAAVRGQVELAALSGIRGPDWTRIWLLRLGRWIGRIDSEGERVDSLVRLLGLASAVGDADAVRAGFAVIDAVRDDDLRAKALVGILGAAGALDSPHSSEIRSAALERAPDLAVESARRDVWARWLEDTPPEEAGAVEEVERLAAGLRDPGIRAEVLGLVAGTLARLGAGESASRAWAAATAADQEAAARPPACAARAAAAARAPDERDWAEVLDAVASPDPEAAAALVESAAGNATDLGRLAALEERVARVPQDPATSRWRFEMALAVARGWERVGEAGRGARLARRALAARKRLEEADFRRAVALARRLAPHPAGATAVIDLVPVVADSADPEVGRYSLVARAAAAIEDPRARGTALAHLRLAALQVEFGSRWRRVEALARIATELASAGHPREAHDLLTRGPLANRPVETAEGELLQPGAKASALAQLGRAFAAVSCNAGREFGEEAARALIDEALEAAGQVSGAMGRPESCAAAVEAWEAAWRARFPGSEAWRVRVEALVRSMAEDLGPELGDRWKGVAALARAFARTGRGPEALALADEIEKDADRGTLLVELVDLLVDRWPDDALRAWRAIPTAGGRRRAARAVFERTIAGAETIESVERPVEALAGWPGERSARRIDRAAGVTCLVVLPVALYGLAWGLRGWLLAALAGPYGGWWTASLAAGLVVALWAVQRSMRRDMERWWVRLGASVAAILFSPFVLGFLAYERYAARRFRLRARWSSLTRPGRARAFHTERARGRPRPDPAACRALVRASIAESGALDPLLAGLLTAEASRDRVTAVLAALPGFRLPTEAPAEVRESRRTYAELERALRWRTRARRRVSAVAAAIGTKGTVLLLAPGLTVSAWRGARRLKGAQSAAVGGGRALERGDTKRGVKLLGRAVRLAPDNPHYWHDYALVLHQTRRVEEAIAATRKAIALGAGLAMESQFWYGLGFMLWNNGRDAEAIEAFDQVLRLEPPGSEFHVEAERGRGYCISNLGGRGSALRVPLGEG